MSINRFAIEIDNRGRPLKRARKRWEISKKCDIIGCYRKRDRERKKVSQVYVLFCFVVHRFIWLILLKMNDLNEKSSFREV